MEVHIYPFRATVFFLYPLKTSENIWFSHVFRGYTKKLVVCNGLIRNLPDRNKHPKASVEHFHKIHREILTITLGLQYSRKNNSTDVFLCTSLILSDQIFFSTPVNCCICKGPSPDFTSDIK